MDCARTRRSCSPRPRGVRRESGFRLGSRRDRKLARHHHEERRHGKRRLRIGRVEPRALVGERGQLRRGFAVIAVDIEMIRPQRIDRDDEDIRPRRSRRTSREHNTRHRQRNQPNRPNPSPSPSILSPPSTHNSSLPATARSYTPRLRHIGKAIPSPLRIHWFK